MKRILYLAVALLFVGCVDKELDLGNMQGNIGINAEKLTFPLAYMEERSLDQMLENSIDGVTADPQTGDYSISYSAANESLVIDGATNSFEIPGSVFEMEVEYPSFKLSDSRCVINNTFDLGGKLGGVDITLGHTINMIPGLPIVGSQHGEVSYMTDVHLPEYVERIERIYVAHSEEFPGAPMEAVFDLGSLGDVNGGGTVSIELKVPEDYEIYDEQFNRLDDHIFKVENRVFAPGQHTVKFTMYVGSIINHHEAEDGELHIPGGIEYNISYNLTTQSGVVSFEQLPSLSLSADLECEDAEIILGNIDLLPSQQFDSKIEIDAFNESIKSIKSIDLAQSHITLFVEGFDWWDADAVMAGALNDIFVEVTMPECFKIKPTDSHIGFNETTNTLHATLAQLKNGIDLTFSQLDFGVDGLIPGSNGKIEVNLPISLRVALEQGAKIRLKYLQHEGNVYVRAGYDDAQLTVASVKGRVDFKHTESLSFSLADLGEQTDIEINGLGISPVIDFSLTNPLTVPLYVSANIAPMVGGVAEQGVSIDKFEIKPATVGGESVADVIPTQNRVRIGKNPTSEAGVTTVDCDLESLFNGALPEEVAIDLEVGTDPEQDVSLVLLPAYQIDYGYSFFLPLAFGSGLDLKYSGNADGIGETVSNLSLDISATGSVSLICEVENSTPLNLALELQMLDKSGRPTPLQIKSDKTAVIKGSKDGVTPCKSTITLSLSSTNKANILDGLKDVETLRYTLHATSAANGVSLNSNQTISGTFALQVDGNVNINLTE